jgi:hypothetical protein
MLRLLGLASPCLLLLRRSIIASSLNVTLFPYCRYIKTLDFRDLENLLDDDSFKGNVQKQ